MSQSLLEAFGQAHREGQRAFNEGDFERAFTSLAPDVEWEMLPSLLDAGVVRGREAVIRYFRGVRDAVDWHVEAQEFIDAGEGRVIVRQRGKATGRTTRISADDFGLSDARDFFQLWELGGNGQIVRVREFEQREDALEAAGLLE